MAMERALVTVYVNGAGHPPVATAEVAEAHRVGFTSVPESFRDALARASCGVRTVRVGPEEIVAALRDPAERGPLVLVGPGLADALDGLPTTADLTYERSVPSAIADADLDRAMRAVVGRRCHMIRESLLRDPRVGRSSTLRRGLERAFAGAPVLEVQRVARSAGRGRTALEREWRSAVARRPGTPRLKTLLMALLMLRVLGRSLSERDTGWEELAEWAGTTYATLRSYFARWSRPVRPSELTARHVPWILVRLEAEVFGRVGEPEC